ncbi:hypothetical protein JAAARDRAFT_74182 [Jaapia argillacea MUCL 33604]|uniref:Ion transport domain-containing protein n=1 Tax=Jaapia argillacea MUCL 33604 TaxID=933084 RepID=A0A067PJA7_9AGAM|nr:hypothetical protein JAAARDRAFT_74182 [Jaapia argillacea MUCL 33604]
MSQPIPLSRIRTSVTAQFLSEHPDSPSADNVGDLFPHSTSFDGPNDDIGAIYPQWKRSLYELLEQPTSSQGAFLVHILTTSLIVISALVTVLETVPAFHYINGSLWFGLETSLVALFTVEYTARCVARSYSWRALASWIGSFFGIIDILAILPYYIEISLHQDTSVLFRFSILRTFRLVRVFRPFRYNNTLLLTIEVMYLSFRRSQHALLALGFFVLMVLTVFSTLLYFAERGSWDETLQTFVDADGDPSQFSSIPAAAWFVLVTITTVGYGEITPRSFLGRLITLPLLLFGLLLIALPSFVLGREFSIVWERMTRNHNPDSPHALDDIISPTTIRFQDRERDLTNRKLAHNQAELSRQITDLRMTVEAQGEAVRRLLDALQSDGLGVGGGVNGKGKTRDVRTSIS